MIQFPSTLVPNYIDVVTLPRRPRAVMKSRVAIVKPSLKLSDTAVGGTLNLVFKNYPTQQRDILQIDTALNIVPCHLEQYGWELGWRWFEETTEAGHLAFEIPNTHAMWKMINFEATWRSISLGGLSTIWRVDEFTNGNQSHVRQTTDFVITISQELRTPGWV